MSAHQDGSSCNNGAEMIDDNVDNGSPAAAVASEKKRRRRRVVSVATRKSSRAMCAVPERFNNSVFHSMTKRSVKQKDDVFEFRLQQDAAVLDQRTNAVKRRKQSQSRRDVNGHGAPSTPRNVNTPPLLKRRANAATGLPFGSAPRLEDTLVDKKLAKPFGKKYKKQLERAFFDEEKEMKNGGDDRKVDIDLFSTLLMDPSNLALSRRNVKTRIEALVGGVFLLAQKHELLFKDILLQESRAYLRDAAFKPWKIQQTIDAHSGLNYQACDLTRTGVEELAPRVHGVMPTGACIAKCAKLLEEHAEERYKIKIEREETEFGAHFKLPFYPTTRAILKAFKLEKYGIALSEDELKLPPDQRREPLTLTFTGDGARFTTSLGHVTAGMKLTEPRAKDPLTGCPIAFMQSRRICFPYESLFGPELKEVYPKVFGDFLSNFQGNKLILPATDDGDPELTYIDCAFPVDVSCEWKATDGGGGSQNTQYSCSKCMCSQRNLAVYKEGDNRCDVCKRLDRQHCFCHQIIDQDALELKKQELARRCQEAHGDMETKLKYVADKSNIDADPLKHDRLESTNHIDFDIDDPNVTEEDLVEFGRVVVEELELRIEDDDALDALINDEDIAGQRAALKDLIKQEDELKLLQKTVSRHDAVDGTAERMLAEICVPDILHLDMRVVEKLLRTLVNEKLHRCISSKKNDKKVKSLARMVQSTMQKHVLGTEANPARWTFPWRKEAKGTKERYMDNVGLSGRESKKCINGLKRMAQATCVAELDEESRDEADALRIRQTNYNLQQQWAQLFDTCDSMMLLVAKREDSSDTEIDLVHIKTNTFMSQWVDITGATGQHITNYIHMTAAGHLCCHLKRFKNLWRFSQQGWESVNQKWKKFYFHNANRGGNCGRGSNVSGDHLCPLMRMNVRCLMWRCGCGTAFFGSLEKAKKNRNNNVVQPPPQPQQQQQQPASGHEPTLAELLVQAQVQPEGDSDGLGSGAMAVEL